MGELRGNCFTFGFCLFPTRVFTHGVVALLRLATNQRSIPPSLVFACLSSVPVGMSPKTNLRSFPAVNRTSGHASGLRFTSGIGPFHLSLGRRLFFRGYGQSTLEAAGLEPAPRQRHGIDWTMPRTPLGHAPSYIVILHSFYNLCNRNVLMSKLCYSPSGRLVEIPTDLPPA